MKIVVKIGTKVITQDDGLLDIASLKGLVAQIAGLQKQGHRIILVTSGAMAAGKSVLNPNSRSGKLAARQVLSAVGQVTLMDKYIDAFARHKYLCAQVLITKDDFRSRGHYLNIKNCFGALLLDGVIPIVNENEVVSVEEAMFTDNDELAGLISSMLGVDKLLFLTSADGVYDDKNQVIPEVAASSTDWKSHIETTQDEFGRGGMHSKGEIAQKLAKEGIEVRIANGRTSDILLKILAGENVGTRFTPVKRSSPVKRWLAHAQSMEKAKVIVNQGAADRLVSAKAASLLPVGIVNIEGEFNSGDLIAVYDEGGNKIGIGKAQYDSTHAEAWLGKKGHKPLIHYNYLYVD